jgi:hypothetical protein
MAYDFLILPEQIISYLTVSCFLTFGIFFLKFFFREIFFSLEILELKLTKSEKASLVCVNVFFRDAGEML